MNKIQIKPEVLYRLLTNQNPNNEEYKLMEDNIIDSDYEDGGASHEYILKNKSTGQYYKGYYTDWDIENTDYDYDDGTCTGRIDLATNLDLVIPKTITTIIYVNP